MEGLRIGIVVRCDGDPEGENRVQVKIPAGNSDPTTFWGRLANFYGTSGQAGSFFVPEVGDEVILGFLNCDPCDPVILGSLYSSKNTPPYHLTEKNKTKAIVSRNKLVIEMNEEEKEITIRTPGNNQIVVSDDRKSIRLSDQNGNAIEMNDTGIKIDSCKDVTINAKANIKLTAMSDIETKSRADIKIHGMNVTGTADVGMTMKGSASAELSASGQTIVKGAMVMIN
jgi:uncharacterized protein involved in type VI secretion and phage assembly